MSGPQVSFIIPAYQAAETLGRTLESVVAQTVTDWEAIVVDDGSSDGTSKIARDWSAREPRIHPYRQANAGVSAARNFALSKASGRWLNFLDADDWVAPNLLGTLLELLKGRGDDCLAYCSYVRVLASGEHTSADWCPELQEAAFEFLAERCEPAIHCVLVSRQRVLEVGAFDTTLNAFEDWDLWQRIARAGTRFIGTPEPLAYYQMRPGSLSSGEDDVKPHGDSVDKRPLRADPRVPSPDPRYANGLATPVFGVVRPLVAIAERAVTAALAGAEPQPAVHNRADLAAYRDLNSQVPEMAEQLLESLLSRIDRPIAVSDLDALQRAMGPDLDDLDAASPGFRSLLADYLAHQFLSMAPSADQIVGGWRSPCVDLEDTAWDINPGHGTSSLLVRYHAGGQQLSAVSIPVFGAVGRSTLATALLRSLKLSTLIRRMGLRQRASVAAALVREAPATLRTAVHTPPRRVDMRLAVAARIRSAVHRALAGGAAVVDAHTTTAREIARNAAACALSRIRPPTTELKVRAGDELDIEQDRQAYWEDIFAEADPWAYDNSYEREKYGRTLALLDGLDIGSALELACAEGHFTNRLAARVETLRAADISTRALERARVRCAAHANVAFDQLDFFSRPIDGLYDLVVCSEVLYFAETRSRLADILRKITAAIKPGGYFLTAHAYLVDDDRSRTGFDWGNGVGASSIAEELAAISPLSLVRAIETDLYRIALYRKGPAPPAVVDQATADTGDDIELEKYIVRGGAVATRTQVAGERTDTVPVLLFPNMQAEHAPHLSDALGIDQLLEGLALLRRHGLRSLTLAEFAALRSAHKPASGRPLVLAFDDLRDTFAELVSPHLLRAGFQAELFVTASRLSDAGAREKLRRLQNDGIGLGYRLELCSADMTWHLKRAAEARAILRDVMACRAATALVPIADSRLAATLELAGFDAILMPNRNFARIGGHGPVVDALSCTGQESIGSLIEMMRGLL